VVNGAAVVDPRDCSFGPFSKALLHVTRGTGQATEIVLQNCSALLGDGAVFQLDDSVLCAARVNSCIISHPESSDGLPTGGILVRQTGELPEFTYKGVGNYYHNLQAFWEKPAGGESVVRKLAVFKQAPGIQDEKSRDTSVSPWDSADPLAALQDGKPDLAFRINSQLPQLRQPDDPKSIIGVQHCSWGYAYQGKLESLEEKKAIAEAPPRTKIVDLSVAQSGNGIYPKLEEAVEAARSGDTILIRHNGIMKVNAIRMEKDIELSIKPDENCHPILSLDRSKDAEAALFRLYDGQLRLEQLQFHLQPGRGQFKTQVVVAIMGDGQCTFRDCLATLEETKEVPMTSFALVLLGDPSTVMRMDPMPRQQDPRVRVESSFIRGAGDLVAVRACRPFRLEVEDSLIVLEGSFLVLEANAKDPPAKSRIELALNKVTSYLNDHLIWLRGAAEPARVNRGLTPTQVVAEDCLFASASGKSLVHLEGLDSEEQMKRFLTWEGRHNAYSNFPQMLDQQPSGDGSMALPAYDKTRWSAFTQENASRFEKVKFASPPAAEGASAKVQPDDFKTRPEETLQDYGANLDRLPKPFSANLDASESVEQ